MCLCAPRMHLFDLVLFHVEKMSLFHLWIWYHEAVRRQQKLNSNYVRSVCKKISVCLSTDRSQRQSDYYTTTNAHIIRNIFWFCFLHFVTDTDCWSELRWILLACTAHSTAIDIVITRSFYFWRKKKQLEKILKWIKKIAYFT